MVGLKRGIFVIAGLLILLLVSGCGGAASPSSSGSSNTTAQSTPTEAPTPTTAATPTTSSSSEAVVKTASATVDGKAVTILTDAKGMTLYYFKPDTASKTACTGGCASTWPPLLFTGTGSPQAATKLPGELEVYPNANGKQVIYNDHPLYTYGGDTAPGQINGQGIGSKWFVVPLDIPKNAP
jgi:predicted lipoprotein with Yx(FWY)xxD motif